MKTMNLTLAAAALAFLLSASVVCAQQDNSSSSMDRSTSMTNSQGADAGMMHPTDWSHRYVLTPVEYKRLHALGLTDAEVFAAANAAEATGTDLAAPNLDDPVQMILRGRAMWQIAEDLNIPVQALQHRKPEWDTAEWKQAAERGDWYAHTSGMSTTTTGSERRRATTTEKNRSTDTNTNPPATSTSPSTTNPGTNQ
jgi:hypothetical protein